MSDAYTLWQEYIAKFGDAPDVDTHDLDGERERIYITALKRALKEGKPITGRALEALQDQLSPPPGAVS